MPFGLLVVCVGNVCRSPLAERLLVQRLDGGLHTVRSAGVAALVGEPMDPDAARQLVALGGSPDGFTATQLTAAMVQESDLVLTATRAVRSRVLELAPAALRRTFTLTELAALLDLVDLAPGTAPAEVVRTAAGERSRAAQDALDVPDPYRQGVKAHAAAAAPIAAAVDRIAAWLAP